MCPEVVEHDNVAMPQPWGQHPLQVGAEAERVYGALDRQRRHQPTQAHRPDHRGVRAVAARRTVADALASWRPAVAASHRRVNGRLIDEDEPSVVDAARPTPEPPALVIIPLARRQTFFCARGRAGSAPVRPSRY